MTQNNSPVEFLHESGENPPKPSSTAETLTKLARKGIVPQPFAETGQKDPRVFDALTHGWYLYPLHSFAIEYRDTTDNANLALTGESASITPHDTGSEEKTTYACEIETGWHVHIDEGFILLVQGPVYNPKSPVIPQVYTETTEPVEIRLSLHTDTPFNIKPPAPIAQVLPFPTEFLPESEYTISPYTEEIKRALQKRATLRTLSDTPYEEFIRQPKHGAGIRTEMEKPFAHHHENK